MSSIFLSHSHQDKLFARNLAADLRHAGHTVWIDEGEIRVGDSLVEKIREGLDRVDFVAAILSEASIGSEWVKRELDIASNREIDEKRVMVLPLLLEDVELPGFLRGKYYADFRKVDAHGVALEKLLDALGSVEPPPKYKHEELAILREQLNQAKAVIAHHSREQVRKSLAISSTWSPELRAAVEKANAMFPQHKAVNEAYAFEAGGNPITLDYMLWAIAKAGYEGTHPLEVLLSTTDKWQEAERMIEAYSDYLDFENGEG